MLFLPGWLGYDADVEAWITAVAGNGGTLTNTAKTAVREMVYHLKATNLWAKISRLNPMVGTNLSAAVVPVKVGSGANATDVITGFVGGDWGESTGLNTNTAKYLDTGLTPSNAGFTVGNGHHGVYIKSVGTSGTYLGSQSASALAALSVAFGVYTGSVCNDTVAVNGMLSNGHWMANALGGLLNTHRKGIGGQVQDSATAGAVPTATFTVGAVNNAGTPGSQSVNGKIIGYHIGQGLTKAQARQMGLIWQNFQTRMGRAITDATTDLVIWGDSLTTGKLIAGIRSAAATTMCVDRGVVGQTATQIADRCVLGDDTTDIINVFLMGKNDLNNISGANAVNVPVQNTVIAQIARAVGYVTARSPRNSKYLVLMTLNGRGFAADQNTGNNYLNYLPIATSLSATYGGSADGKTRYHDTRSWLVAQYDPGTPQDVIDHGFDTPPSTLMGDSIHWNSSGWNAYGTFLNTLLFTTNGW